MADTFNTNPQNNQNTNKQEATNNQEVKSTQISNNEQEASEQATDYSKVQLSDRTSTHDVDNHTRDLHLTEKDGTQLYVQLQAPKLNELQDIQDARFGSYQTYNGQVTRTTTADFYEHLFPLFHNLQANSKPAGTFGWDFGEEHYEAFNWFVGQADSFLTDTFPTN